MDVGNCYTFKQQWISVKDRLPKSGQRVLVVGVNPKSNGKQRHVCVCTYYNHGYGPRWTKYVGITHWMPLPELPEV